AMDSVVKAAAMFSAWRIPTAFNSRSVAPWQRPCKFQSVAPWRTKTICTVISEGTSRENSAFFQRRGMNLDLCFGLEAFHELLGDALPALGQSLFRKLVLFLVEPFHISAFAFFEGEKVGCVLVRIDSVSNRFLCGKRHSGCL